MNLFKQMNWIGCYGKKKKSSEAIRVMKLILYRNVHNICLYKNYALHCHCPYAFVIMATLSFHRRIMGKMKVGHFFFNLTADILTSFTEIFLE